MDLLLREAIASDAAALASLSTQLGYPVTVEVMEERLRTPRDAGNSLVVAEVNGAVLGCMEVAIMFAWESGRWSEIRGLVVDSNSRSQGIGAVLVAHAKAWTRSHGLTSLRVRTNEVRTRTHGFYERLGFTKTKSQRVYDVGV